MLINVNIILLVLILSEALASVDLEHSAQGVVLDLESARQAAVPRSGGLGLRQKKFEFGVFRTRA